MSVRDPIRYRDRATGRVLEERVVGESAVRFLHADSRGRKLTDLALRFAAPSMLYGLFQRMARSRKAIPEFIRVTGLDAAEAEKPVDAYRSLDDFFTRRLKPGLRPLDPRADRLLAPADGRVLVYPEIGGGELSVKGSKVTLRTLLGDAALAKRYEGGSAIVVRLAPPDYHRFHFPDTGRAERARKIGWHLYSVSPIALAAGAPSFKNKRQLTVLHGDHFGDLLLLEIGAIGVGRIVQTYKPGPVHRGQEKGLFRFGGSTTMIVAEPGRVRWDDDLVAASREGLETLVRMGTAIATKR